MWRCFFYCKLVATFQKGLIKFASFWKCIIILLARVCLTLDIHWKSLSYAWFKQFLDSGLWSFSQQIQAKAWLEIKAYHSSWENSVLVFSTTTALFQASSCHLQINTFLKKKPNTFQQEETDRQLTLSGF